MMRAIAFGLIAGLLLLAGCAGGDVKGKDDTQRAFVTSFLEKAKAGDADSASPMVAPEVRGRAHYSLKNMPVLLSTASEPFTLTEIRPDISRAPGSQIELEANHYYFQAKNPEGWISAEIYAHKRDGKDEIFAYYFRPEASNPLDAGKIEFGTPTPKHWVWIGMMIFSFVICVLGALIAWRTWESPLKWLAILGSLLFTWPVHGLIWTTAERISTFKWVQPFGFGIYRDGPHRPWEFDFGVPLIGAAIIVHWLLTRHTPKSYED